MIITVSWPRFAQVVKEFCGLPADTSDDELEVRLASLARQVFDYAAEYGVRVGNLSEPATKSVANFHADISGVGIDFNSGGFDWPKLLGGLRFLKVIAVTIEREDLFKICDGLVGVAMNSEWYSYRDNLARLSPEELQATFEAWCRHVAWGNGGTPDVLRDPVLEEIQALSAFEQAGIEDPLKHHLEQEEFNRHDIEAWEEAKNSQLDQFLGIPNRRY